MGIPYLEYYDKEESAFSGEPIHSFCMANCKRITYTMGRLNKVWTFCIFLEDRILELTADNRDSMLSWCRILERTLHAFGNLRKTSSEHVYSAYPIKRPPRKSLPVTPPDSPEPLGAEALPPLPSSNQGASSGSSEKEDIFESQSSLMDTLRNSGNLQNASAGLRESLIFANQNSSTSDEDVCNSFPEDGVCRSIPDDMGTEGDIDSDPEYSEAAWIIDDHHHVKHPNKGKPRHMRYHGDSESSASEPDTTGDEDFVAEDFFVSNKKLEKSPAVQRRFRDDLGIRRSPTPQPVRPVSMINYPASFNIYENYNPDKPLDLGLNLLSVPHPRKNSKKESHNQENLKRSDQYSVVRRPRMCSGDHPTTPTNPDMDDDNYDVAKFPLDEDLLLENNPYLAMADSDKNRTLTKEPLDLKSLDDGYQAIRSDASDPNSFDYEDMSCDTKKTRVSLPSSSDEKRLSGRSEASSTNRDSGSVFEGSRNSSSKEENLYAPFPGGLDSRNSEANMESVPSLPPPRQNGSESPKCSSPEKPPRNKKDSNVLSPPHSNRNSRESRTPEGPSPIPPPLESIPVRRTLQEVLSQENIPCRVPPKPAGHARSLSDLPTSNPEDPDKGNFYSVQPLPPKRKNIPPPTDYAFVTPKPEERGDIPQLPPPRGQVPQRIEGRGVNSPPQQSFKFKPGKSEPTAAADCTDDSEEYEDATGMNGQPPRPPPRLSMKPNLNKSKSYHNAEERAQITQDDAPVRPKSSVVRQQSLQERQRISQTVGVINVVPLKQSQVEILQQEQRHPSINVTINRPTGTKIALVDCFEKVWVAGWDMKTCPRLNDKIHIGDQLLKINDKRVKNSADAQKMYKSAEDSVILTVQRLPYAQVIAIHRQETKQPIGIQRDGGTSKIVYVDPNGLAAKHGLQQRARSVLVGSEFCYWCLTEINSRPLDLSFKGNEIEHLLNAVGKDISIVVQPEDFMKELKKQLKKLKNYKELLMRY